MAAVGYEVITTVQDKTTLHVHTNSHAVSWGERLSCTKPTI